MQFADRVKEMRRVKPEELRPHPDNWRLHGQDQRSALRYVLGRIGIAGVSVAYDDPEWGLTLIDGHMRQSEVSQEIPTVILDVTRAEAQMLLLSMDSISAMADREDAKILKLVQDTYDPGGDYLETVRAMIGSITAKQDDVLSEADAIIEQEKALADLPRYPLAPELNENYDYVVILCRTERDYAALRDHLKISKHRSYKNSEVREGRIVMFDEVRETIGCKP